MWEAAPSAGSELARADQNIIALHADGVGGNWLLWRFLRHLPSADVEPTLMDRALNLVSMQLPVLQHAECVGAEPANRKVLVGLTNEDDPFACRGGEKQLTIRQIVERGDPNEFRKQRDPL